MCLFCDKLETLGGERLSQCLEDLLHYTVAEQRVVVQNALVYFTAERKTGYAYIYLGKLINLLHNNTLLAEHLFIAPSSEVCPIYTVGKFNRTCLKHGPNGSTTSRSSSSSFTETSTDEERVQFTESKPTSYVNESTRKSTWWSEFQRSWS